MSDSTRNVRVRNSILLPTPPGQDAAWEHSNQQPRQNARQQDPVRRRMTLDDGTNQDVHGSQALPALSAPSSSEVAQRPPHSAGASSVESDTDKPPPGCAPDAIKLFVGSIPKSCTESQLLPFFETIGKVVDLVIVRDKATRESKGSAFLWYASRAHAEIAILHFNLRHVLPDPSGEHHRPLVLRRAKPRAGAPLSTCSQASSQPTSGHLSSQPPSRPTSGQLPAYAQSAGQSLVLSMNAQSSRHNSSQQLSSGSQQGLMFPAAEASPSRMATAGIDMPRSLLMTEMLSKACSQGPGSQARPPLWISSSHPAYNDHYADGPTPADDVGNIMMMMRNTQLGDLHAASHGRYGAGMQQEVAAMAPGSGLEPTAGAAVAAGPSAAPAVQVVSASLDLSSQQMSLVNAYMHSLQDISGAQLSVSVGPSMFRLRITGLEPQVEMAKTLLGTIMYAE